MNVVLVKLDPNNPDTITWDELQKYKHRILWQDPFFKWKAVAEVCFEREVELKEDMPPHERFLHLYLNYRGVESIRPNHVLFLVKYLAERLNRTALLKYLSHDENSRGI